MSNSNLAQSNTNLHTPTDGRYILPNAMKNMVSYMRELILAKSPWVPGEGYYVPRLNEFDEEKLLGLYLTYLADDCPFEYAADSLQMQFANALISGDACDLREFTDNLKAAAKKDYMDNIYTILNDQCDELGSIRLYEQRSA